MRRGFGVIVLTIVFGVLALADVVQLGQAARGLHPDPPSLLIVHGITGLCAGAAAVGTWRSREWASILVLSWGVITAGMLVALGPVLDTPEAERPSLWLASGVVLVFSSLAAVYLHRRFLRRDLSRSQHDTLADSR